MTAYQSPFQFGTLATNDNFIDRVEDRALLKQLLSSHINVMLISPRRWGKSSLVKKAMSELADEDKSVRVCYIDAFSIGSEAEFYRTFASQVIACASSKMERWMEDAKKFVPQERDKITILQLPEMLAKEKGIKIKTSSSNWLISQNTRTWKEKCAPYGSSNNSPLTVSTAASEI